MLESLYSFVYGLERFVEKNAPTWLTNLVPADKIGHFLGGALVALPAQFFLGAHGPLVGLTTAAIVGVIKELLDWYLASGQKRRGEQVTHSVEALDAIATTLGGALVSAVFYFMGA